MFRKNRCFELFEKSENSTQVAVLLFFHLGICSFIQQIFLFIPIACKVLWEICLQGVYGIVRDLKGHIQIILVLKKCDKTLREVGIHEMLCENIFSLEYCCPIEIQCEPHVI